MLSCLLARGAAASTQLVRPAALRMTLPLQRQARMPLPLPLLRQPAARPLCAPIARCLGDDTADDSEEMGVETADRVCPGCGTPMKNWRRHMARCCPDELNAATWDEDSLYIWAETVKMWGAESLEARVISARFGLGGAERRPMSQIAETEGLKAYKVSELVQQVLQRMPFVSDNLPVEVLFEDEHFIALAKPPMTSTTPRNRSRGGAMLNRAVHHFATGPDAPSPKAAPPALEPRDRATSVEPFVVHRLDYNTSGVLLFAKTRAVANSLSLQFREPGRVRKAYLALVALPPACAPATASGEWLHVEAPIGRGEKARHKVRSDGREAATWLKLLATSTVSPEYLDDPTEPSDFGLSIPPTSTTVAGSGLLLARPLTGRTHQIRVHATHCGLPLLGDEVYGLEIAGLNRHALHAWSVSLDHPVHGHRLHIHAPLPDDLTRVMDALGLVMPGCVDDEVEASLVKV